MSFSRLVSEARLQVAASHLCDGNGPGLAEIAFLAGFSDQAHFARTFSRAVGVTPSSYRANFGQQQFRKGPADEAHRSSEHIDCCLPDLHRKCCHPGTWG